LVATALLVVWITDFAINAAPLDDLTLRLLLAGRSPFQGLSLPEALWTAVSRSAILLGAALLAAIAIGVLSGAAFAFSRWRVVRAFAWAVGTVGASLPSFFWAMLLQLIVVLVYLRTQRLLAPVSGGFGVDQHLILPAIALAMRPAAYIFRTTATAFDEARHAPYVITAWAKGLGPALVARRHVARNAAPAVLAGMALGAKTALFQPRDRGIRLHVEWRRVRIHPLSCDRQRRVRIRDRSGLRGRARDWWAGWSRSLRAP